MVEVFLVGALVILERVLQQARAQRRRRLARGVGRGLPLLPPERLGVAPLEGVGLGLLVPRNLFDREGAVERLRRFRQLAQLLVDRAEQDVGFEVVHAVVAAHGLPGVLRALEVLEVELRAPDRAQPFASPN